MKRLAPKRDEIIKRLHAIFGGGTFHHRDIQRTACELNGRNYDEKDRFYRNARRRRGYYECQISNTNGYFYRPTADGLVLRKLGNGLYQIDTAA